jgi:hypothetical protein
MTNPIIALFFMLSSFQIACQSLVCDTPFGKWKKLAYFVYEPKKTLLDSTLFNTTNGIAYYNFFKRAHGWKEQVFEVTMDTFLIESTIGKKHTYSDKERVRINNCKIHAQVDSFEILYFKDDILVLNHDAFLDLYVLRSKQKKKINIPDDLIISLIKRKYGP